MRRMLVSLAAVSMAVSPIAAQAETRAAVTGLAKANSSDDDRKCKRTNDPADTRRRCKTKAGLFAWLTGNGVAVAAALAIVAVVFAAASGGGSNSPNR